MSNKNRDPYPISDVYLLEMKLEMDEIKQEK